MNPSDPDPLNSHRESDPESMDAAGHQPQADSVELPKPWISYGVIAGCIAICGYFNFAQGSASFNRGAEALAPDAVLIWSGSYWGLLTSAFVHFELWHLLFNMWWVKDFGKLLEPTMGRFPYLIFLLSAAVLSSGFQLAASGETGIGFSGVVYAMFGYALAAKKVQPIYERILDRTTIRWLLGWLVVCVVLTMADILRVANAAHIGGLIFGWSTGQVWAARKQRGIYGGVIASLAAAAIASCIFMPWSGLWRDREQIVSIRALQSNAEAGDAQAQFEFGHLLAQFDEQKEAGLEWIRKSAEQGHVPAMNGLAWIRATATDERFRDGAEALKWGTQACEGSEWKEATFIDTLAAAYAELEKWDEAVAAQQKAITQLSAEQKQDTEFAQSFQTRLEQYRNRQKTRE